MSILIEGTFVHTKKGILEIVENGYMLISKEGKITYFSKKSLLRFFWKIYQQHINYAKMN